MKFVIKIHEIEDAYQTHTPGTKKSGLSFFLSVLNFYARIDIDIEFEIKIKTNIDNILSINIKNKLVLAVATDIISMREVYFCKQYI